jgi:hypothetical protein
MVLSRTFLLARGAAAGCLALGAAAGCLALVAVAGCGESLFDAHGKRDGGPGGDGGPDGPDVPRMCPQECIGDAAKEFSDSTIDAWRYVDDTRDRRWVPMTVDSARARGTVSGNEIQRCADNPTAAGCQTQRDALLISSTGAPMADPAIEFTFQRTMPQAVRIAFRAHASADHAIHLYRNSREDILFRGVTETGKPVERSVLVDALPGDRFLIAFEPTSASGGTVALDFFIYDTDQDPPFPSSCLLTASFEEAAGNTVKDRCTSRDLTSKAFGGAEIAPTFIDDDGPFKEQLRAVDIATTTYFETTLRPALVRASALTIQFWVRVAQLPAATEGFAFSDLDEFHGGRALSFFTVGSEMRIHVHAGVLIGTNIVPGSKDEKFMAGAWKFVRLVETASEIRVCVDGAPLMSLEVAPGRPQSTDAVYLGKNADLQGTPMFDGDLDDLRVFAEALPCAAP